MIKPKAISIKTWLKLSEKQKIFTSMHFSRKFTKNQIMSKLFIKDRQFRRIRFQVTNILKLNK